MRITIHGTLGQFGKVAWIALACALALTAFAASSAQAQTFRTLYTFQGANDGELPEGQLALDAKGYLYGTTRFSQDGVGYGTVYKLSPNGKLSVVHAFAGEQDGDGANAESGLIQDAAGDFYGTAPDGGYDNQGVIYSVDKSGKERVLYRFTGGKDGQEPQAGLVRDASGNLYGTASVYGLCAQCGTVFEVSRTGKGKVLYSFQGPPDAGYVLTGDLVLDETGNLYGVSYYGGQTSGCVVPQSGCGTVFELSPNGTRGWNEKVLYRFKGGTDGAYPFAGLVRDTDGNLYGTTQWGGNSACEDFGCGTIFKLDPQGNETVLYRFSGGKDGAAPGEVLIRDGAGNFYGTATNGGSEECKQGCGTVFKLDPSGKLSILHSFKGPDGALPCSLLRDSSGNLFGVTNLGGSANLGTIFEITP